MGLFFAGILLATAMLAWWISGYDPKLTGENQGKDILGRLLRCGFTLFLMAAGLAATALDPSFGGVVTIIIAIPMVILWLNCLGEAFAQAFHSLIDAPPDSPSSNPNKLTADLDQLAVLSNRGQTTEALQLCAELLKKGEASRLATETMCFHLYSQMFANESLLSSPSLSPIYELCESGRFTEAESHLTQMLDRDPENLLVAFLLIRLYARDLQEPEKARALIQSLERRPNPPPMFSGYAEYQIEQWLGSSSGEVKSDDGIESLLVRRRLPQKIEKPATG
jgi:tetratricopeptide (TPR) repeat protein